jgi:lipoate-protein ligase A
MKILPLSFDTAQENLAFEEWYFQNFEEETLRIWRSPKSVVVGKHQNALAEVNLAYCLENNVPVLRRISGGGTVYHDLGNFNFSFFRFVAKEKMIDYVTNLDLIKASLNSLSYNIHMSDRHDLFSGEFKISGNAQHIKKGRALHHGTILYNADLKALSNGIKRTEGIFQDKSVKSVRSPTINLQELTDLGSTLDFQHSLLESLTKSGLAEMKGLPFDIDVIQELAKSKYDSENWNFGYSPSYSFEKKSSLFQVQLSVERGGNILSAQVLKNKQPNKELSDWLIDKKHHYLDLSEQLKNSVLDINPAQLLAALF